MAERIPLAERIERDFTYYAPHGDQAAKYAAIRAAAKWFATELSKMTPECREQSLAITHLEEVVMWANAAVARNG